MKHKMVPAIDCEELRKAVNQQYNIEIEDIPSLLFDDNYMNDCYKSYYLNEQEQYSGFSWQNEETIRLKNCVNAFLTDAFPNVDYVLIDVSW